MPSALPDGEPAPADGSLPAAALARLGTRPFGFYVHVPFCTVRCGYCDFNTYTAAELGRRARRVAGVVRRRRDRRDPARPAGARRRRRAGRDGVLRRRHPDAAAAAGPDRAWSRRSTRSSGWRPDAEVTTESNPDSVDAGRPGGAARGRHQPDLVRHAVGGAARAARCSTAPTTRAGCRRSCGWARDGRLRPGQPRPDLRHAGGVASTTGAASLDAALACEPDHVSAYALIVEEGTALARQIRRGEVPMPDDDDLADKYLLADEALERRRAGLVRGVELGPRRRRPRCRHNVAATGPAATGGASGRARTRTSAACAGGTSSTRTPYAERIGDGRQPGARPRGARRRDPPGRAGAAGDPAASTGCRSTSSTTPAARRCRSRSSAGSSSSASWLRRRVVLTTPRPAARRRGRPRPARRDQAEDQRVAVVLEVRRP